MLKGKQKEHVEASADRLGLNKDLAAHRHRPRAAGRHRRLRDGEWDTDEVRRLFTSLEFRSLFDRLQEIGNVKPKVDVAGSTSARSPPTSSRRSGRSGARSACDSTPTTTPCAARRSRQAARRPRTPGRRGRAARGVPRRRRRAEVDSRRQVARAGGAALGRRHRRHGVRHDARRLPARPGVGRLPAAHAGRDVPRRRRARRGRGRGTDEGQLFADVVAHGRGRGRRDRAARTRDEERIEKQGLRLARRRGAPALVGARAHGGPRHPARRRLPRGDGGVGPRPDGDPQGRGLRARRRGVQPQLATAATQDPLRTARPQPGRRHPRASSPPMRACSRSFATRTRSSTRCCRGASSTS